MSSAALQQRQPALRDVDLVDQARAGGRAAFEQLYRRHAGRVYALCLRLTADADRAEQLTQDAFVQAWRKLPGFRGESAFTTWLHRVTVNVVLDSRRADARRRRHETELDAMVAPDTVVALRPSPPARVGERLDLERAIARLPEGARTVVVLHEVEGHPVREVAELLRVAEGTVKAQLFRARRLLREVLQ